jgi:hypothetical protein
LIVVSSISLAIMVIGFDRARRGWVGHCTKIV